MRKQKLLVTFLILSFFSGMMLLAEGQGQQPEQVLPLEGPTWDHQVISLLVIPSYDQSWWNPDYLDSVLRAVSEWNDALSYFATNHSEFSYMSQLRLSPEVSNTTIDGFDAYLSWINQFGNQTCDAGLTKTTYTSANEAVNATVALSALDCLGNVLNVVDMQNVALHELGHCWGLGHANFTDDLMFYSYSLGSPIKAISTLDAYGVGTVFRWLLYSSVYDPANQGTLPDYVTLPPTIAYEYLPISASNTPVQGGLGQLTSFLQDVVGFVLQPEILILILLAISAVAVYAATRRAWRRRAPQENTGNRL